MAKQHEKARNQRQDTFHKMTTQMVREHDIICTETLRPKNMVKNRHLTKAVSDASFGEILRQLKYKCEWYGRTLVQMDAFFPSSQLCSACGYQNSAVKDLSVREWTCPECGTVHDRDINAANNILAEGLRILAF